MKPASFCLVTADLAANFTDHAIRLLKQHGWRVHVLFADAGARPRAIAQARRWLADAGIGSTFLSDRAPPRELRAADPQEPDFLHASDRVRIALEVLHRRLDFDLVEFSTVDGPAFRLLQAKRAAAGFADVGIVVRQHLSPLPDDPPSGEQLLRSYCERQTLALADFPILGDVQNTLADYERMRDHVRQDETARPPFGSSSPARTEHQPLVTVVVHYRNQPDLLPLTLRSLADQTYRNLEVHVIDDGSDDVNACMVFAQQEQWHPGFAFEHQPRVGAWPGRNRILAETAGDYFLPLTATTILRPAFVEHLVQALHRQPSCAAVVGYVLGCDQAADLVREHYSYARRPVGGPVLLGGLVNIWGEGNGLFRTAALRASGGGVAPASAESDWPTYARLACHGGAVGVLPEHLGYQLRPERLSPARREALQCQVLEEYHRSPALSAVAAQSQWKALASLCAQPDSRRSASRPARRGLVVRANSLLKKLLFERK